MKNRKFVILGGGTAGWITAHSIRRMFPNDSVTVVYSEKKGIIGVGEATTPMMTEFLNNIGVDIFDFLKKTGGTIKHAISFENWNGDGKNYLHPFYEKLVEFSIPGMFGHSCFDFYNKTLASENLSFQDYLYQGRLAEQKKIDITHTTFAVHFNTYKFGEYLKEFSKDKNIEIIVDEYKSVELNDNKEIIKIVLENQSVDCDFVFDCSGFARLLIKDVYQEEWISYRPHLPMKKAIAFWLDAEDKIPPYTSAIAMKYGWMWKIPLQDRFGCGYVYDSDYIDEFQAQEEVEKFYNQKIDVRRVIDIDAGRYKNVWVKNCIAVGLSGNFIEPLESTSIWLELALMFNLKHFANEIDNPTAAGVALFNEIIGNEVDEKMNFVYLHYMTKRLDSEFWREFRQKNIMPEKLKKLWPYIISNNLRYHQINDSMCPAKFPLMSYIWISAGLELIENRGNFDCYNINPPPEIYKAIIDFQVESSPDQRQFLSNL
jgi:tryptophan halogenase